MNSRLARLRHRFSPSLVRLGADGPSLLRRGGAAHRLFLVGRELCLFLHVDASAVPAAQRESFVGLEVRRSAPFPDPEHDAAWFGDHAAVWYWSHERVRDLLVDPPARPRFSAEARMRGQLAEDDEAQLLSLQEGKDGGQGERDDTGAGYDARLWRHGHLIASRWWPHVPLPDQWQAFLRGGGMDPSLPIPVPAAAPLLERALGSSQVGHALFGQLRTQLAPIAAVAGALVVAAMGWQLFSGLRISSEIRAVEQEVAPLEQQLEAIIDARSASDDAAARIDAALSLRPASSQTRLLAEVQTITPGAGWAVMGWHQPGPDSLEVTLKGTGIDTAAVVAAWEQSPLLRDVTPSTGARADEQVLRARLTPFPQQTLPEQIP